MTSCEKRNTLQTLTGSQRISVLLFWTLKSRRYHSNVTPSTCTISFFSDCPKLNKQPRVLGQVWAAPWFTVVVWEILLAEEAGWRKKQNAALQLHHKTLTVDLNPANTMSGCDSCYLGKSTSGSVLRKWRPNVKAKKRQITERHGSRLRYELWWYHLPV